MAYLERDAELLVHVRLPSAGLSQPPSHPRGKYRNAGLPPRGPRASPTEVSGTLTNGILVLICVNPCVNHSAK